jgi:hypothetical protein
MRSPFVWYTSLMNTELRIKDWTFEISVTPSMPDTDIAIRELLEKQNVKDTLKYFNENQDQIQLKLMNVIREDYEETFKEYGEDEEIPAVENDSELKELLMPLRIYIHETVKDGYNYVGFGFDARWQEEHGIGVLMHKNRIVQHGGEDHAFLDYMSEEDAKLGE